MDSNSYAGDRADGAAQSLIDERAGLYVGAEMSGVEMTRDVPAGVDGARDGRRIARLMVHRMREERVLISVCGPGGDVLKVRPPMVFSRADADWFCEAFAQSLADLREYR